MICREHQRADITFTVIFIINTGKANTPHESVIASGIGRAAHPLDVWRIKCLSAS